MKNFSKSFFLLLSIIFFLLFTLLFGCDKVGKQADFYRMQERDPAIIGKWDDCHVLDKYGDSKSIYYYAPNGDIIITSSSNHGEGEIREQTYNSGWVYYTKDNILYKLFTGAKNPGATQIIPYEIKEDTLFFTDTQSFRIKVE